MTGSLLPLPGDFKYRGSPIALWLLGAVLFMRLVTALGSIFNGHTAASVADGIPIDSFTPAGASTVVALFGAMGVMQALVSLAGAVVIWRYRALVPAFTLFLIIDFLARKAVTVVHPIPRTGGTAGMLVNWGMFAMLVVALLLALRQRRRS
jgi:MYXO-CTERM domain-containing protein